MEEYGYAHFDTSKGERKSRTSHFNRPDICGELQELRSDAFRRSIPTADDETLCFILSFVAALKPKKILEIGTAVGISAIAMLSVCPKAHITSIEKNTLFFKEAESNFIRFGVDMNVSAVNADAGETLPSLTDEYDFIFMDCAKAQYIKYLPELKRLLKKGGTLVADDVLLFGWLTGESEVPKKRKMLYKHVCEYVEAVTSDAGLITTVMDIGDGLALSVKR